jgi:hypothetical protein
MGDWVGPGASLDAMVRNAYEIFIGKPEGKRSLAGCRRKLKDNVRIDIKGTG